MIRLVLEPGKVLAGLAPPVSAPFPPSPTVMAFCGRKFAPVSVIPPGLRFGGVASLRQEEPERHGFGPGASTRRSSTAWP